MIKWNYSVICSLLGACYMHDRVSAVFGFTRFVVLRFSVLLNLVYCDSPVNAALASPNTTPPTFFATPPTPLATLPRTFICQPLFFSCNSGGVLPTLRSAFFYVLGNVLRYFNPLEKRKRFIARVCFNKVIQCRGAPGCTMLVLRGSFPGPKSEVTLRV